MNARYQDPVRGQFISEDPVFLNVSNTDVAGLPSNAVTGLTAFMGNTPSSQTLYLASPQAMNAYSYSLDNPITYRDPSGKCIEDYCITEGLVALLGAGFEGIPEYASQYDRTGNVFLDQTGRNLVLGKAISGGAAALTALYNPAVAASLLTAGTLGTEQAFNPTSNPSELGSRTGTAVGGGLTLNLGDNLTDEILNPDLQKFFPDLYGRVKLELGGGIDLANQYVHTFVSGGNVSQPTLLSQGRALYPNPVGGGSSYLPTTITENGLTYVRNSSGLLNFATSGKTR